MMQNHDKANITKYILQSPEISDSSADLLLVEKIKNFLDNM